MTPERVDPRLRARRAQVERSRRRSRRRVVAGVAAAAVVAALGGGWVLVRSPLLDVERVAVQGAGGTQARDVVEATGVDPGDPLLLADLDTIEARVERLPWVREASARRRLPDRLDVQVASRTAVAWAPRGDEAVVVDGEGRVFAAGHDATAGVPQLVLGRAVPGPGDAVGPSASRVLAGLPPELRGRVAVVAIRPGSATLTLSAGPEVRLGEAHDVAAKARAALAVLAAVGSERVAYIDVRVPDAPVTG